MRYKIGKDDFKYVNAYGAPISERDYSKSSCLNTADIKEYEVDKEANPQVHVYSGGVVVADAAGTTTITSDGKIINSDGTTETNEDVLSEKRKKNDDLSDDEEANAELHSENKNNMNQEYGKEAGKKRRKCKK